jgi:parvulin-like peptidyl-prolyl isomerase
VSSEEREEARRQFQKQHGITDPAAVEKFLAFHGLQPADLEWQIELPLKIRRHCRERFHHKAEARFLSRKNQLDRVVYSLLRVKDGLLARELYLRIGAGETNFADLAAQFAEGPERSTKGIIGPVPLTQAHPVLAEKLRTSSPGVLMEPFPLEQWWLVVRLERYAPAHFDETMAQKMANELFEEWVNEETTRKLRSISLGLVSTVPA